MLFLGCVWGLRDSFWCTGGSQKDCEDIRKNLECTNRVVQPMQTTLQLKIGSGDVHVWVRVFCGWETASSQIRIMIVLVAIYNVTVIHKAIMKGSVELTDRFLNSSQLLVFFLFITGLFDFLSIYDSINDNYGLCMYPEKLDYQIHSTLKSLSINCQTGNFKFVGIMMVVSSIGVFIASQMMKRYRLLINRD